MAEVIEPAVTINTAEAEPCGTVTVVGTEAAVGLEVESETIAPPVPAAEVRVTVPVPDWPPTIVLGLTEMALSAAGGGLTVIPELALTPEYDAVSVAEVEELTVPAVTVNVVEVEPLGTVTVDGTLAAVVLELESETITPPVPAADESVTVPVPDWPLTIVPGLTEIALRTTGTGSTVTANVAEEPDSEAVSVAGVGAFIAPAVTVKLPELDPCETMTVAGTVAALVLELESDTTTPPLPAGALRLTMPAADWPLMIVPGLTETLLSTAVGGLMVTPNVALTPEYDAVKVAVVEELTVPAVTVNVAEVEPAGTVTLDGTVAAVVLELESEIATPPVAAAEVRVTVPVADWPLMIVPGLTETLLSTAVGGLMVTPNVAFTPEYDAVKVAGVEELTVPAVTVNVAEVEPAGTVTLDGTVAAVVLELDSDTATPPVPAAEVRVTVPVPD